MAGRRRVSPKIRPVMSGSPPFSDRSATPRADTPPQAPQPDARPPGHRRWPRRLGIALASLLALWVLAWLAVPPLLKWQGEKAASALLGRPVHIGAVDFRPWSLALTLSDLGIDGAPGAPPLLTVRRVFVDGELQSLLRLAPVIDAIRIESPALRLTHLGEGRYDIDDILARLAARPPAPEPAAPPRLALYNVELTDGRVDFDDRVAGQQHELRDVRLALPFLSTLPSARQIRVQPHLAFVVDGSAFDSRAQALPFDDSRQAEASLRLEALDLKPYLAYLPAALPVRLQAATLDADLRAAFEQSAAPSLRVTGSLALSGLKAVDAQGADLLAFDALKLQLGELRPLEQRLTLASVELNGPRLALRRRADGQLDLLAQMSPGASKSGAAGADQASASGQSDASSAAAAAAPAAPPAAWQLAIDRLAVHGGALDFSDASTAQTGAPAARMALENIELAASQLAWPLKEPLSFKGAARLAPGAPAAEGQGAPTLAFDGTASLRGAEVKARVDAVPLALGAPYLAGVLAPRLDGRLDAQLALHWAPPEAAGQPPRLTLNAERLALGQLALTDPAATTAAPRAARPRGRGAPPADDRLAAVELLELQQLRLDWPARAVRVGRIGLRAPRVRVAREADGRWMAERWLRTPPTTAAPAPATGGPAEPAWALAVDELAVADATLGWRDAAVAGEPVELELTQLHLGVRQFTLEGHRPMPVQLATRVRAGGAEPGRLGWRGSLTLSPLALQGTADVQRLPAQALVPYVGERLNVDLLRADASFKGQLEVQQTAQGPRVRVAGDASVEELRAHSRPGSVLAANAAPAPAGAASAPASARAALAPVAAAGRAGGLGEELLTWKLLRLAGVDLRLDPGQPPRIGVGDTVLSDFFARVVIHPDGHINLQDVLKSDAPTAPAAAAAPTAGTAPSGATPATGEFTETANSIAAGAPSTGASAPLSAKPDALAPVIHMGPLRLAGGRVDFSDRFIRPNYSADLSDLAGTLGAFGSVAPDGQVQMAELQLSGRAEGSAQLQVTGRLNPLATPLALDIRAKMSDLELPPLSPYAVKYAGHGIERGKLSMDVNYRIQPDGQLTASNQLVLNQLQFGEPVAGAPASLPVRLATALLSDSNGVIDLDLPISGSLNDPQFSLGPVIVKAIFNLIGKAITAPFTLLARALGGAGDDLSQVAFAPGSARLDARARQQLDRVAKALADRPQLKLTVIGSARLEAEREGWRRERLQALLAAEQRAEAATAPAAATAAATVPAAAASAPSAPISGAAGAGPAGAGAPPDAESAMDAEQRARLLRRLYRRADVPGRPRNAIGLLRDVSVPEMEALLLAHIDVGEDAMRQLAVQRGVAVKDYLASRGAPAERLFLGAARAGDAVAAGPAGAASAPAAPWSPRAELTLATR